MMMTTSDVAKVIQAVPGMADMVKLDGVKMSRRNILLLNAVIMSGLNKKDEGGTGVLLEDISKETVQELMDLAKEFLQKAGLNELTEALKTLGRGNQTRER